MLFHAGSVWHGVVVGPLRMVLRLMLTDACGIRGVVWDGDKRVVADHSRGRLLRAIYSGCIIPMRGWLQANTC